MSAAPRWRRAGLPEAVAAVLVAVGFGLAGAPWILAIAAGIGVAALLWRLAIRRGAVDDLPPGTVLDRLALRGRRWRIFQRAALGVATVVFAGGLVLELVTGSPRQDVLRALAALVLAGCLVAADLLDPLPPGKGARTGRRRTA